MKGIRAKKYTKKSLAMVKGEVLENLSSLSGGLMIPGCCNQGCYDPDEDVEDYEDY